MRNNGAENVKGEVT